MIISQSLMCLGGRLACVQSTGKRNCGKGKSLFIRLHSGVAQLSLSGHPKVSASAVRPHLVYLEQILRGLESRKDETDNST